MKLSFFHQAHLNNWETYTESLTAEAAAGVWDDVILTAANSRQAAAFQYQLDQRRDLGMLPARTRFQVIADPGGMRIGSGGATLHALHELRVRGPAARGGSHDGTLEDRRILILHSGGDSKRLPQYSAYGKVFAPIPRLLACGRPSTLFDELFVALSGLPSQMAPGVVIASGDVLLLFDHSQLDLSRPGLTGVAIRSDADTASHHGVYVADDAGRVQAFLHKPGIEEMKSAGALLADGGAAVDTGIVFISAPVAERLLAEAEGPAGWIAAALPAKTALNLYGDFLLPLAPRTQREAYLADESDGPATPALRALRERIWATLRGTPFYVGCLDPARFLHFGTVREYQRLITYEDEDVQALGGHRRVSHFLAPGARVDERACILHSAVGPDVVIEAGVTVEFSEIGAGCRIAQDAVVSGIALPEHAAVPSAVVVHALPVLPSGDALPAVVVRVWGSDDNPKATASRATFLGSPMLDWLRRQGIAEHDVWPDSAAAERTLWNARLYPAAQNCADAWQSVAWMLRGDALPPAERAEAVARWRTAVRFSLQGSYECADLERLGKEREGLFARLVQQKCLALFREEAPVADWLGKIPTLRDMGQLVSGLAEESRRMELCLERVRLDYSITALLRQLKKARLGRVSAAHFEGRAFGGVAEIMLRSQRPPRSRTAISAWQRERAEVLLPARIDLAGGWSDTPPHSLERGGVVLNAAIRVDGILPIQVEARRLAEPVFRFSSADLGVEQVCGSIADLFNYDNPHDPLAIHKATLVYVVLGSTRRPASFEGLIRSLGGGLSLTSRVKLPKGTGLGTSSILAASLAKALIHMVRPDGEEPDFPTLFDAAAAVEQMLTTGGGWQDQVGGLVPGLKLTTSRPGEHQELHVERVDLSAAVRTELDDRLLVLDTGQRRLAKNLLREIMAGWLARERHVVEILAEIQQIALEMRQALAGADFARVGESMWRHWELNKRLDRQTSNEFIDSLMAALAPHVEGAKLAGAGGGGFLMGILKPGRRETVRALLANGQAGAGVRLHDATIAY